MSLGSEWEEQRGFVRDNFRLNSRRVDGGECQKEAHLWDFSADGGESEEKTEEMALLGEVMQELSQEGSASVLVGGEEAIA